jgi:hypothetical protein
MKHLPSFKTHSERISSICQSHGSNHQPVQADSHSPIRTSIASIKIDVAVTIQFYRNVSFARIRPAPVRAWKCISLLPYWRMDIGFENRVLWLPIWPFETREHPPISLHPFHRGEIVQKSFSNPLSISSQSPARFQHSGELWPGQFATKEAALLGGFIVGVVRAFFLDGYNFKAHIPASFRSLGIERLIRCRGLLNWSWCWCWC